ncbi:DDE-type integrase/transposase/recombinase [Clostridium paraputrificum]|uniref:DDE-type integrase/transposase/recombinase n=1 Tax=Clostridium paraputrificum TaxID=29363 RepID=UPI00325C239D
MNSITQDMRFHLSIVKSYNRIGATKTAIRYKVTRQFVYFWVHRFNGDIHSLADHSHRPHHHPNQHTDTEIKWIKDLRRRNPDMGLIDFWLRLKVLHNYSRSVSSLYRVMRSLSMFPVKKAHKKRINKPYVTPTVPGAKIQIDVKYVPTCCLVGDLKGTKLYQYTAIDEASRLRYLAFYEEHSTYSSTKFLMECIKFFPFKIQCIQTDNGFEFTNRLVSEKKTLFEEALLQNEIVYHPIRPATPRHNGKVERSHREDQKRFYDKTAFYSLEDASSQLKKYLNKSNNRPTRPLGYLSPIQFLTNTLIV